MVKRRIKHSAKPGMNQGQNEGHKGLTEIYPNTLYEYCCERLSPFGGLLALEKFMDAVQSGISLRDPTSLPAVIYNKWQCLLHKKKDQTYTFSSNISLIFIMNK